MTLSVSFVRLVMAVFASTMLAAAPSLAAPEQSVEQIGIGSGESAESVDVSTEQTAAEENASAAEEVATQTAEEQAAALNTNAASEHYYLGAHYLQNWDLDMAEVELEQSIRFSPDLRIAHRDLCVVSLLKFNLLRSIAEFMMVTGLGDPIPYTPEEQKELDDKALIAHYKKALNWGKQFKWHEAATELEWALKYRPDDFAVHRSLAFAYANLGEYERAEKEYRTTFELAPKDGFAHADLANFLQDRGQLEKAQSELEAAVALQPKASALHVDLGWVAELRGDLKTASKEFKVAVTLSPQYAELWSHLGKLLEQTGESPQAVAAYSESLRLRPDQPEIKESLARMKAKLSASSGHGGS